MKRSMEILITGSKGFIGKNLVSELQQNPNYHLVFHNSDNSLLELEGNIRKADCIFHLASVIKGNNSKDFHETNVELTKFIVSTLVKHRKNIKIIFTSTIKVFEDTPYGRTKKAAEDILINYSRDFSAGVVIYRLPNVFGKWSKPFHNSIVATLCYTQILGQPISLDTPQKKFFLVYIDDLVKKMISNIDENISTNIFQKVEPEYEKSIDCISNLLSGFNRMSHNLFLPNLGDSFEKKLFSTFQSFIPRDFWCKNLDAKVDNRGEFVEIFKTEHSGQISVNIIHPGITKGMHWHQSKAEKFVVISGKAEFIIRNLFDNVSYSIALVEDKKQIIDIVPGCYHSIKNNGDKDLIVLMWANDIFDPESPDTNVIG